MYNICKNVICLFLINAFVIILNLIVAGLATFFWMFFKFYEGTQSEYIRLKLVFIVCLITMVAKYFVLPISYKKLENSQKFELVAIFIRKLKQSWCLKIVVLIIAYLTSWLTGYISFEDEFYRQLVRVMLAGLFGCYIVLFVYWYIEDKIKQIIKNKHIPADNPENT